MSRPTRFPGLFYDEAAKGLWRIMDADGAGIGQLYASKAELLADLDRYAADYFGTPNPRMVALTAQRDAMREALTSVVNRCDSAIKNADTHAFYRIRDNARAALAIADGAE